MRKKNRRVIRNQFIDNVHLVASPKIDVSEPTSWSWLVNKQASQKANQASWMVEVLEDGCQWKRETHKLLLFSSTRTYLPARLPSSAYQPTCIRQLKKINKNIKKFQREIFYIIVFNRSFVRSSTIRIGGNFVCSLAHLFVRSVSFLSSTGLVSQVPNNSVALLGSNQIVTNRFVSTAKRHFHI